MISTVAGCGQPGDSGDGGLATQAQAQPALRRLSSIPRETPSSPTRSTIGSARSTGEPASSVPLPALARRAIRETAAPHSRPGSTSPTVSQSIGQGNLFFVDRLNRRVRRVDAADGSHLQRSREPAQAASSGDGGPAAQAGLVEPNGVALDPEGRSLYIADVAGHRIRKVDLTDGLISTFAGTGRPRARR